ncbi:hypothetical protein DFS34DRAFT_660780 [Phlyctochytrium arcticum]|nr:hypothetical protein DFS34DRAFT_660780 [Phlyctochytrium arcticum]
MALVETFSSMTPTVDENSLENEVANAWSSFAGVEINDDALNKMGVKELRKTLREVLLTLRDKERDLVIAAEVGQHLMEAHAALREAYDNYLTDINQLPKSSTFSRSMSVPCFNDSHSTSVVYKNVTNSKKDKINQFVKSFEDLFTSSEMLLSVPDLSSSLSKPRKRREERDRAPSMEFLGSRASIAKSMETLTSLRSSRKNLPLYSSSRRNDFSNTDDSQSIYTTTLEKQNVELQTQIGQLEKDIRDLTLKNKEAQRHHDQLEELRAEQLRVHEELENLTVANHNFRKQIRDLTKERLNTEIQDNGYIERLAKKLKDTEEALAIMTEEKSKSVAYLNQVLDELGDMQNLISQLDATTKRSEEFKRICAEQQSDIEELKSQLEDLRGGQSGEREEWQTVGKSRADRKAQLDPDIVLEESRGKNLHESLEGKVPSAWDLLALKQENAQSPKVLTGILKTPGSSAGPETSALFRWSTMFVKLFKPPYYKQPNRVQIMDAHVPGEMLAPSANHRAILFNIFYGYLNRAVGKEGVEEEAAWSSVVGDGTAFGAI